MTVPELQTGTLFSWNNSIYVVTGEYDGDSPLVRAVASWWPHGRGGDTPAQWIKQDQLHRFNPCCEVSLELIHD